MRPSWPRQVRRMSLSSRVLSQDDVRSNGRSASEGLTGISRIAIARITRNADLSSEPRRDDAADPLSSRCAELAGEIAADERTTDGHLLEQAVKHGQLPTKSAAGSANSQVEAPSRAFHER